MARVVSDIEHKNGTVGTTAATISFFSSTSEASIHTEWIQIQNMDSTTALLVSFDGGTTYFSIKRDVTHAWEVDRKSIKLKSTKESHSYEILAGAAN